MGRSVKLLDTMFASHTATTDLDGPLREALEQMLVATKAASAAAAAAATAVDTTTTTTTLQREALDEKRRRLLRLLEELATSSTAPCCASPPSRHDPPLQDDTCEAAAAQSVLSDAGEKENCEEDREALLPSHCSSHILPPPPPSPPQQQPQRLLGNIFCCPVRPTVPVHRHKQCHHRRGSGNDDDDLRRSRRGSPAPSPPLDLSVEDEGECTAGLGRERFDGGGTNARHCRKVAAQDTPLDFTPHPQLSWRAASPHALTRHSSPPPSSLPDGPQLYEYTCVTPTFWINVWPCFGITVVARPARATRVLVKGCYRYFEDVVERAAAQTACQPACPSLYTPDGRPVRALGELAAEDHYLLFPSGGFYRTQAVPTALLWLLYSDARRIVQTS